MHTSQNVRLRRRDGRETNIFRLSSGDIIIYPKIKSAEKNLLQPTVLRFKSNDVHCTSREIFLFLMKILLNFIFIILAHACNCYLVAGYITYHLFDREILGVLIMWYLPCIC